ncbi:MAG: SPFH domain-containing protein [Prevotella sp.]|jgi:regulator of protease activity HflC (stomatin/prohibitin superfamily)|nr:SPFH domain-containing protein [Prevotella sp.]MCI1281244.1 SPFH domain-containing protein [Prevotella sp.]
MENQEFAFKGKTLNGFDMLFGILLLFVASIVVFIFNCDCINAGMTALTVVSIAVFLFSIGCLCGFIMLEPNEARVMMFFGNYRGTFTKTGFYWVNPFITTKKLSLRARNLDAEPIKVNDKIGNPVMIGQVLVWRLKDTYKATFDIDAQAMQAGTVGQSSAMLMRFYENFVKIQGDAALRKVAGEYAYDDEDGKATEATLRGGGEHINEVLEKELKERLDIAGIEVVEARINYLAYAPEIAAVMLRRQQASAIISAREKIVEGAVGMVKLAIDKLAEEEVIELDDDKKAAMVSNLMVVLCGDDTAQPIVNAGTLNM